MEKQVTFEPNSQGCCNSFTRRFICSNCSTSNKHSAQKETNPQETRMKSEERENDHYIKEEWRKSCVDSPSLSALSPVFKARLSKHWITHKPVLLHTSTHATCTAFWECVCVESGMNEGVHFKQTPH